MEKTKKIIIPLVLIIIVLLTLSACTGETYGIEVGTVRREYCDALNRIEGTRLTTDWLSCYDCYEGENNDVVVARYSNKVVVEVETFNSIEPQSKTALEKKIHKNMDFLEMVKLAGVPQIQFRDTNTLDFSTNGEETLRTYWEKIELADGSSKYTLQDFEFWLPTEKFEYPAKGSDTYIYEGMPMNKIEHSYRVKEYMDGFYLCYVPGYYDKIIIIEKGGGGNGPSTYYIKKIYSCLYGCSIGDVIYLRENLQLGMSFPEVVEMAGTCPLGELDYRGNVQETEILFKLGPDGQFLQALFCNWELVGFRFLESTGEQTGDLW